MKTRCWAAAYTSSSAVVVPHSDINRNGWKFNLRRRCVAQAPPTFFFLSLSIKIPNTWAEHKSVAYRSDNHYRGNFSLVSSNTKSFSNYFHYLFPYSKSLLRFGFFFPFSWGWKMSELRRCGALEMAVWACEKKSSRIFVVGAQDRASTSSHPKHKLATN